MTDPVNDEVLIFVEGRTGRIRLNRPKAIHALTHPICTAMIRALTAWASDDGVDLVMIDHAEGRGFCAGGDIRHIADSAKGDGSEGRAFFHEEYRLNHLLFTYAKPTIAFMDGITMGGGVGISQPCSIRVVTERTMYAMPETGIGLFTDVGGGRYLSRMPGRMGQYVGLTGARLNGAECLALALGTHYVESDGIEALKAAILGNPGAIDAALRSAVSAVPPAPILDRQADIDRLFASDRYEDIVAALAADGGDWALATLKTLETKSPQACKVVLRLLAESARIDDFAEEMAMEYAVVVRVIQRPDIIEGVRALIVDKDNAPRWNPPTAAGVSDADIDAIFAPLPPSEAWTPLPNA
ncbi:enoyl-CoA hydratase/isomerase family protein [Sphingomonas histidinilytica]|jgi:enoyl-CoA hydratase|uniref:3-hydroxyisobutyryl-CoA hydrolase n=1 Tax=Rhizorhabdus histidinilytica TaxID=439228 RepID=A0A1T5GSR5_9SPHN|nr:enoyl-CoA hydratase/isomerase family protein [Rhizorhabdus histidinilytica]MBO9380644.1 enoyl-CoA hydratase/isomerase family protein [Rhizorhabdus histidinilytica]QEH77929.1 enoyl-CoA hydratase/isomerase family protein [Sphingomonas sp. C8-2]SKC11453.1 enoyl-CoA hydratase [Rhizorhabdus histidinilytica]